MAYEPRIKTMNNEECFFSPYTECWVLATEENLQLAGRFVEFKEAMIDFGWSPQKNLIGRTWWIHKNGRQVEENDAFSYYKEEGYTPPPF